MPICSYIIYPMSGQEISLEKKLAQLPHTQVHSEKSKKVFILVSDSPTRQDEQKLQDALKDIEEIQCTALSFIGNPDS